MKLSNVHPVDRLGDINVQIAALEEKRVNIAAAVVALGLGRHEGRTFTATVYEGEKTTVDMKAVNVKLKQLGKPARTQTELLAFALEKLGFGLTWITGHTQHTTYVSTRTARKPVASAA